MSPNERVSQLPAGDRYTPAGPVDLAAEFAARWARWQTRGVAHDSAVRHTLFFPAALVAITAAILYVLFSW